MMGEWEVRDEVWEQTANALVTWAYSQLSVDDRRHLEPEDIAQSTIADFFRVRSGGGLAWIRDDRLLWPILTEMCANKIRRKRRAAATLKRGGATMQVYEEQEYLNVVAHTPAPDVAAELRDEYGRLLGTLVPSVLRMLAARKIDGASNDTLAKDLNVSIRTIERKLKHIATLWESRSEN